MSQKTPQPASRTTLSPSLYLVTAVSAMGYGSVITLFADFRDEYGFSGFGIGTLGAAGFLAGFLSQLFLSRYADRGFARSMVRIGLGVDLIALLWMASTENVWQFVAARLLLGLGAGICSPAIRKVVISRDPDRMGYNLGKVASYDIAGFTLGPVVAAVVAEVAGLRWPFITMAAIYLAVIVIVWNLDLSCPLEPVKEKNRKVLPELLRLPGIQAGIAAAVAFFAALGAFEVSWALLLSDRGAATWLIGLSLTLFTIPMIFFAPLGGRITQQHGALKIIVWSVTLGIVCVVLYGWVDFLWVILAVSLIHGIADAFTLPGMQVAISASSPREHVATGQGLLSATGLAVAGIMSLIGGPVYDWGGAKQLYTITAVIMLASLLITVQRSRVNMQGPR